MRNQDEKHLRLLVIFHYVLAGIAVAYAVWLAIFYGSVLVLGVAYGVQEEEPDWLTLGLLFLGACSAIYMCTVPILLVLSGRNIARKTRRTFCMVVAAMSCIFFPLGTILGVFTILVLNRPSVVELFDAESRAL